jgi:hypothetical protein
MKKGRFANKDQIEDSMDNVSESIYSDEAEMNDCTQFEYYVQATIERHETYTFAIYLDSSTLHYKITKDKFRKKKQGIITILRKCLEIKKRIDKEFNIKFEEILQNGQYFNSCTKYIVNEHDLKIFNENFIIFDERHQVEKNHIYAIIIE